MVFKLNRTGSVLNRSERLNFNENWDKLEKVIKDRGLEILSEVAFLQWLDGNNIKSKDPVDTFESLPNDAENNELRGVLDENAMYLYNGEKWVHQSNINFNALDSIMKNSEKNGVHSSDFPRINGEEDDSNALNRMIIYAYENGYNNIIFDGEYKISSSLMIYNSKNYIFNNGSIKQTLSNTPIFEGDNLSNVEFARTGDFELTGHSGDFVEDYGRRAIGIFAKSTVAPSTNLRFNNLKMNDFTHSGIMVFNALNCIFEGNEIKGTFIDGVDEGKNYQFGICLNDNPKNCYLYRNIINKTAQGILIGKDFENIHIKENNIHDIIGQHGLYINYGRTIKVDANIIERTNHQGIKTQIDNNATTDSYDVSIENNTITHPKSHAILIANVQSTPNKATINISIKNNKITGVAGNDGNGAGVRVDYGRSVDIQGNTVENMMYGAYYRFSENVRSKLNIFEYCGYNGYRVNITSFSSYGDIIFNAGVIVGSNANQGIYIDSDKEVNIDNTVIDEDGDYMNHSLILSSSVSGKNLSIKNSRFLKKSMRIGDVSSLKEFDNNVYTDIWGALYPPSIIRGTKAQVYHGTKSNAPISSAGFNKGDRYEYTDPSPGDYLGVVLVSGAWKGFGMINS